MIPLVHTAHLHLYKSCIHFNRDHDLVQTSGCKMSFSSWCSSCVCSYPLFHFICWFVELFTCQCLCVLAFLYWNNCLHEGDTRLCMKIRQAWLEQGNGVGGAKWKGCGLEGGERERVHWSEMGHQGRARKADKKRRIGEKKVFSGGHSKELQSSWREGLFSDWFQSAYRFACEHNSGVCG